MIEPVRKHLEGEASGFGPLRMIPLCIQGWEAPPWKWQGQAGTGLMRSRLPWSAERRLECKCITQGKEPSEEKLSDFRREKKEEPWAEGLKDRLRAWLECKKSLGTERRPAGCGCGQHGEDRCQSLCYSHLQGSSSKGNEWRVDREYVCDDHSSQN